MITLTKTAAKQIRKAADQTEADDMMLRIAARKESDGSIEYGMGFDDMGPQDQIINSEGVDIIVSNSCIDLLRGTTLDFVEINPGEFNFIFINPNDSRHKAPTGDGV